MTKSQPQDSHNAIDHSDDLDVLLSVPRASSSRKSLVLMLLTLMMRRAYFLRASQLTILMKSTFDKDDGKNDAVDQAQTPSKEKDIESIISSQC